MKRATLLNRLVDPSPSGRIHDMECSCVKWDMPEDDGWSKYVDENCPKCRGSGRVSQRLSRREAHAIVTYYRMNEKVAKRATEEMYKEMLLRQRMWRKRFADNACEAREALLAKARQCGFSTATKEFMDYMLGNIKEWRW